MTRQRLTEKFYPITTSEHRVALNIQSTARDLFIHLRTLDPFGDGMEINVSQLAREMGRHRSTISRALKTLRELGWLTDRVKTVRAIQLSSPKEIIDAMSPTPLPESQISESTSPQVEDIDNDVHDDELATTVTTIEPLVKKQEIISVDSSSSVETTLSTSKLEIVEDIQKHPSQQCNTYRSNATPVAAMQHPSQQCNKQHPKPKLRKDSKRSKTYSDYLDSLKTLREEQRERFMEFCRRKADSLPNPVRMLEKWIAANFEFLKAQYISETGDTWGSSVRKKKIHEQKGRKPLPEKIVTFLNKCIKDNKIKNFWYCEPLTRWMVLLDRGQMEVDIYLEKQGVVL